MLTKAQCVLMGVVLFYALCLDGIADTYGLKGVGISAVVICLCSALILLLSDYMDRRKRL